MSWRIDNLPDGGLMIEHLAVPRFTARWTTGEFPIDQVRDGAFFWTDEGGSPEDAIHLYGFAWEDVVPGGEAFEQLMARVVFMIEASIIGGL
ncbi:hypothetical protein [Fluviibacterium sp. S390]|uniref:hypothetical protein n=1 Tax=Fluviibacterium sp. S390 TaxID=3415139 RepID=UPI003C7D0171